MASKIFVFLGQDTSIGKVEISEDKYFFNIGKGDQIFFLKENIGKGYIEFYRIKGQEKVRVYYSSPMKIRETQDSSYQIVGGSLRTFYDIKSKRDVKYITFKTGYAFMLKNNWEIGEKEVRDKYLSLTCLPNCP
jgi:hypothetical protein